VRKGIVLLSARGIIGIIAVVISLSQLCGESVGRLHGLQSDTPESESTSYASLIAAIFSSDPPTSGWLVLAAVRLGVSDNVSATLTMPF
jgi:hypothetical protein